MIAHVFGTVAEKFNTSVIVDVHGIGYEVQVSTGDYEKALLNEEVKFYTYHHVREQAQELFGFSSLAAKKLFELLITVQGVGPKAALAVLSLGESETVRNAIANSDSAFVQKASGVGKKTAERVVIDLSDKVGLPTSYGRKGDFVQAELNVNDEALLEGVDTDLPTARRVTEALKAA